MKIPLATSLLVSLLAPLVQADNPRPCATNTTTSSTSSTSRSLQGDSADASLLNRLIALALPAINDAIKTFVPDPLVLDLAGAYTLGQVDLGCGDPISAGFSYALEGKYIL